MGRNDNENQDHDYQVFDLQDTDSDYFEKSHDYSESDRRDSDTSTHETKEG